MAGLLSEIAAWIDDVPQHPQNVPIYLGSWPALCDEIAYRIGLKIGEVTPHGKNTRRQTAACTTEAQEGHSAPFNSRAYYAFRNRFPIRVIAVIAQSLPNFALTQVCMLSNFPAYCIL